MVTKNLMKLYLNLTLNKLHQFNLYITLLYLVHSSSGLQSKMYSTYSNEYTAISSKSSGC